jgi:AraC-like DNA-binding protein
MGSLAFAEQGGALFSTGLINGRVELNGSLSATNVTLGVGLRMPPKNRQWLREVESGAAGIFMPGDEHEALHFPGALYASVTLSEERAEELAAQAGMVLEPRKLGGSGIDRRRVAPLDLQQLTAGFEALHDGRFDGKYLPHRLLDCMIQHFGRLPRTQVRAPEYRGHSRIVRRGLGYIDDNLHRKLAVEQIAAATGTSSRTLFRAFQAILGEGPLAHANRLRMHRVRSALRSSDTDATVTAIASRWGISELGRFAGAYGDLFGESPSETLASRRMGA